MIGFNFFFIPHPAEYGVGEFLIRCHCPDAGIPVGIDLARIWSARGGVRSSRVVLYGSQVDPWSTCKWRGIDIVDARLFGVHGACNYVPVWARSN